MMVASVYDPPLTSRPTGVQDRPRCSACHDADFIETIRGETRWTYLAALLEDSDAAAWIAREHADADTLVLIFEAALGGSEATLSSTQRLRYLGAFAARLE